LPEYVLSYGLALSLADVFSAGRAEKYNMLRAYRTRYHTDMMRDWRKRPHSRRHDDPPSLLTYDLCCQYFKNTQALNASEHTYVYSIMVRQVYLPLLCDSIIDDDDENMPPLEPITPSEPSTPTANLAADAPSVLVADKTGDATHVVDTPTLDSPWNGDASRCGFTDGEAAERAWSALNPNK
jgi:hypothetical protein